MQHELDFCIAFMATMTVAANWHRLICAEERLCRQWQNPSINLQAA
jgi:hypothetical protein